ncbi:hypothetical protein PMM47T1_19738 [Pseudomonas sp. M47T1]|nr:hypothetical protein PMM47T1_19738 [Pseudomonas sp. M47T1]
MVMPLSALWERVLPAKQAPRGIRCTGGVLFAGRARSHTLCIPIIRQRLVIDIDIWQAAQHTWHAGKKLHPPL